MLKCNDECHQSAIPQPLLDICFATRLQDKHHHTPKYDRSPVKKLPAPVRLGWPLAAGSGSVGFWPLSSMDKFMMAQSFSAPLLMPEPLSCTQMRPLRAFAGPRVTNDMVMVRGCPG